MRSGFGSIGGFTAARPDCRKAASFSNASIDEDEIGEPDETATCCVLGDAFDFVDQGLADEHPAAAPLDLVGRSSPADGIAVGMGWIREARRTRP